MLALKMDVVLNQEEEGHSLHSVCPYQPPVPFPQRVAWTKVSKLKPIFARFLNMLRRIYVNAPFLEALKEAPTYMQFFRELLSKKGEPEGISAVPIGEVCNTFLHSGTPLKLQDPGSFSIPCYIGNMHIEIALCDLGANVSLMPFFLCQKLKLLDLTNSSSGFSSYTTSVLGSTLDLTASRIVVPGKKNNFCLFR